MRQLSTWISGAMISGLKFTGVIFLTVAQAHAAPPKSGSATSVAISREVTVAPFRVVAEDPATRSTRVALDRSRLSELTSEIARVRLTLPVSGSQTEELTLTRATIFTNQSRFVIHQNGMDIPSPAPDVTILRGALTRDPNSRAYLALTPSGVVNGYVRRATGELIFIAPDRDPVTNRFTGDVIVSAAALSAFGEIPEGVAVCGVDGPDHPMVPPNPSAQYRSAGVTDASGLRLANVAIDADQAFYDIFGNAGDCNTYIATLIGAISDIYERDLGVRLNLAFVRLWPVGGEPFDATDLGGFRAHWLNNEDTTNLQVIHQFSGQRNTSYGGVAYVDTDFSVCGGFGYGVDAYLNGSFPNPVQPSNLGNWDLIVTSHEMGHNFGTYHTHDGYTPTIDDCGNGAQTRGTIMSYCHIHPGYVTNTDLWMHRQVEDRIDSALNGGGCLPRDCNANNVDDSIDIFLGAADVNANDIPDICEDCNNNSILDPTDILNGAPDLNLNGIPDVCEADCNGNGTPDDYETRLNPAIDVNGNNIPDECEPDCNGNTTPDFIEIAAGAVEDFDRDNIPDLCEDCNSNFIPDWKDLGRPNNIFICDEAGYVREYHTLSGYPIISHTTLSDPIDVVSRAGDLHVYVADQLGDAVLRVNPSNSTMSVFVTAGSGGLNAPSSLVFGPDGNLYVASQIGNAVRRYNGATGAFIDIFVTSGSGGLSAPQSLIFGPDGRLYVSSSTNAVLAYSGVTGVFSAVYVTVGSGGLSGPRGMAFMPTGELLVASYNTDQVLQYAPATGAFQKVFNDDNTPTKPWGVRMGPLGDVYVMRTQGSIRLLEYKPNGRFYRPVERGDAALPTPRGFCFMPASPNDVNLDGIPDVCLPVGCCDTPGDADNGASVDIGDALFIIAFIFSGGPNPVCQDEADADGSNSIDIGDALHIISYIFTSGADPVCGTTGN